MAQRRMFSLKVVDTDEFLDMPQSAQNLYFHLGMRADDDGFIANSKKIMKMIGSGVDDMKILAAKRYVLPFESGIIVIRHFKESNYIQSDRYHPTIYKNEKALLIIDGNGNYEMDTKCIHNVSKMDTEVRLGKVIDRVINTSIVSDSENEPDIDFAEVDEIFPKTKESESQPEKTEKKKSLHTRTKDWFYKHSPHLFVTDADWKREMPFIDKFLTEVKARAPTEEKRIEFITGILGVFRRIVENEDKSFLNGKLLIVPRHLMGDKLWPRFLDEYEKQKGKSSG